MEPYLRIAIWGGAVVFGIVLLVAVMVAYRRHLRGGDTRPGSAWTLEDLSALRQRGELSESEYARLRDRALADMGVRRGGRAPKASGPAAGEQEIRGAEGG